MRITCHLLNMQGKTSLQFSTAMHWMQCSWFVSDRAEQFEVCNWQQEEEVEPALDTPSPAFSSPTDTQTNHPE